MGRLLRGVLGARGMLSVVADLAMRGGADGLEKVTNTGSAVVSDKINVPGPGSR